jgi:hypothetical protein
MAILFDTLKLAQRLEAAGMPPRQAQETASAFAETMTGDIVTRQDLQLAVAELRSEIEKIRSEIAEAKSEIRGWLIAQLFAIAALIGLAAGLSHLFH